MSQAERTWRRGGTGAARQAQDLYATAYLDLFESWLAVLAGSFARLACGFTCGQLVTPRQPRFAKLADAMRAARGGRRVTYWYDPLEVADRFARFFDASHVEALLRRYQDRLEAFRWIRHRISHSRDPYARAQFDRATITLSGRTSWGSSPGRFLRDWNSTVTPRERWLETAVGDLTDWASHITG